MGSNKEQFVDELRKANEKDYGLPAQQALERLLDASLDHEWMYVFELAQNALDAGASRLSLSSDGAILRFQHDGPDGLEEKHVKALSQVGGSTKGLSTIGFMGVGFKAVFSRFRTARVCGSGWRFRFDIGVDKGDFGTEVTRWFDALRPHWDPDLEEPDEGFTTLFRTERPIRADRPLGNDLARLEANGLTPLAVLAARGLRQLTINEISYNLSLDDGEVCIARNDTPQTTARWRLFRTTYTPTDAAMAAFLKVRRQLNEELTEDGRRKEREVIALLPLNDQGVPIPPEQALAYTTLPTLDEAPTGFHIQADWLVNVDRQRLRDIDGNAWQEEILAQIPDLIGQLLEWLASPGVTDEQRAGGYRALRVPNPQGEQLDQELHKLHGIIAERLKGLFLVPIYGQGERRFCPPETVARLTGRFLNGFGHRPDWRPDILFGCETLDEQLMGKDARNFADWLGWGRDLELGQMPWPDALPGWWDELARNDQIDAALALWNGIAERGWNAAPVVPTEASTWIPANESVWLNEEPPSAKEAYAEVLREALKQQLPDEAHTPLRRLRTKISSANTTSYEQPDSSPETWIRHHRTELKLSAIIEEAVWNQARITHFPLIELTGWAMARGKQRQDLVPAVLTEAGPRKPEEALMADPLVEGGEHRRRLFPHLPALDEYYTALDDPDALVGFLKALGVRGHGRLAEVTESLGQYEKEMVALRLGVEVDAVKPANWEGYTVQDFVLLFAIDAVPADALQDWLTREYRMLQGRGLLSATSSYYGNRHITAGTKMCGWVTSLMETPWILGSDDRRHRPADLLLQPHPDFDDALVANIDTGLTNRLQTEGVEFGTRVPRSRAVRRLLKRGGESLSERELAKLLEEVRAELDREDASAETVREALGQLRIRGEVPLSRLVERTGAGQAQHGSLGSWILALTDLELGLAAAISALVPGIPKTTTGQQSLDYLRHIWSSRPSVGIDELRRHIAAAYRYVLEDAKHDHALALAWRESKTDAMIFGSKQWHPLGESLAVDDVQSPLVRKLLAGNRIVVSATHLGDEPEQIKLVARELGIGLLSEAVKLETGDFLKQPEYAQRIRALTQGLARLEHRKPLVEIRYLDRLALWVDQKHLQIRAYVDDGILHLSGSPTEFAAEASSQLVEHFQLSQRGSEIPFLTVALVGVENKTAFTGSVAILSDALGVDLLAPEPDASAEGSSTSDKGECSVGEDVDAEGDTSDQDGLPGSSSLGSGVGTPGEEWDSPAGGGAKGGNPSHSAGCSKSGDGAGNEGGNLRRGNSSGGGSSGSALGSQGANSASGVHTASNRPYWLQLRGDGGGIGNRQPKDDHREKAAVIRYEKAQLRRPEAQTDGNPGFDVESHDPRSEHSRRIEIKGMSGIFDETAAVAISWRQFEMAVNNQDERIEYWLYVVDQNRSNDPGVHPIAWTRHKEQLKFLFEGECWLEEEEHTSTPFEVTELDPGDSVTDRDLQTEAEEQ